MGGSHPFTTTETKRRWPVENSEIATAFWGCIDGGQLRSHSGLLVIAGSTKSGKTELMKQVVRSYLSRPEAQGKFQTLVTCEDPIETWYADSPESDVEKMFNHGVFYCPRQLGIDVVTVSQALKDARRQTPNCYLVGEVREKADWQSVVEFAGSGHLIVVTTHAANIQEAILRIFSAMEVKTPQGRRSVANALLAVVHAALYPISFGNANGSSVQCLAQMPSIWIGNVNAVSQLTADGLSSVVPNGDFCLSRAQFLRKLDSSIGRGFELSQGNTTSLIEGNQAKQSLLAQAQREDLRELSNP